MVEKSREEQLQSIDEKFEPGEASQKSSPEYQMATEDESDESSNFKYIEI